MDIPLDLQKIIDTAPKAEVLTNTPPDFPDTLILKGGGDGSLVN